MKLIFTTLILLNICHYLGDYTHLSRPYMLAAKRFGTPLSPIIAHAWVHAGLMAIPLIFITHNIHLTGLLVLFQFVTHFIIDVLKGKFNYWFKAFQNNTAYPHWYLFGFDQFLHQLVIIIMAYFIFYS